MHPDRILTPKTAVWYTLSTVDLERAIKGAKTHMQKYADRTQVVRVRKDTHRALRLLAALRNESMLRTLDRLVIAALKEYDNAKPGNASH
jgi:predicted nucleic acid-binding protein